MTRTKCTPARRPTPAPPLRKPREEPPPARYIRSKTGVPARLKKTSRTDPTGRLWLYRLDYGRIVGTQEWTLPQLQKLEEDGHIRWLKNRPDDLPEREIPEPEDEDEEIPA